MMEINLSIKPGDKIKINFGKKHHNNKLYHVLGVFDETQIACKYYWGFRWYYKFENIYYFQLLKNDGLLEIT
jgi:hypothetical protein